MIYIFAWFIVNDGEALPSDNARLSEDLVTDPTPPASNVSINATWTFSSGINITNVMMTIHSLKSSQYAAMGLSQNHSMV